MSITDELRKEARGFGGYVYTGEQAGHLTAIADRIDAEHKRAMADAYLSGTPTDEKLTELGWIRLPKDADNVPWNVGDRDEDGNVVTELRIAAYGWWVIAGGICRRSYRCRHYHHAPTVEDVLTEFGIDWEYESDCEDRAALLKEYAAKLRLAEGEDA